MCEEASGTQSIQPLGAAVPVGASLLSPSHSPAIQKIITCLFFGVKGRISTNSARLAAISRPFDVVVANVPGPQIEPYLLGSPIREAYPLVPLYKNQALGIALFSYHGGLFWGLNADWDALPDLHVLVEALALDFQELRKAART